MKMSEDIAQGCRSEADQAACLESGIEVFFCKSEETDVDICAPVFSLPNGVGSRDKVSFIPVSQNQAVDAYFFYIRLVLVAIFVGSYVSGVVHRREPEVHSRYMLCTGLPLIDPVVHRLAQRLMDGADLNYQMLTFGIPCMILAVLFFAAKHTAAGRRAMAAVFAAFVVGGLPLAFNFYTWGEPWSLWKGFSKGFASLPLT